MEINVLVFVGFGGLAMVDLPVRRLRRLVGVYPRQASAETLARTGHDCVVYDGFSAAERRDWLTERPRMTAWLRTLPKHSAVFAAMDGRARIVLDACAEAGINVPNEIVVRGVDNDPVLCEAASPQLSSIRTGDFDSGCAAAKMLDALMDGRRPKKGMYICSEQMYIDPSDLFLRLSPDQSESRHGDRGRALHPPEAPSPS